MLQKSTIPIRKMHCRSCELLVEQALRDVPGIEKVRASATKHEATIYSHGAPDADRIRVAIESVGYEVGQEERRRWITRDTNEYAYLALAALFAFGLYVVASRTGLLSLSTTTIETTGFAAAFAVGLTAGLSTCMALVGGLILGIAVRHAARHPEATLLQKFRPHLFFNLGRIGGFFFLGGLLGAAGGFLMFGSIALGVITMIVALVMLLMGLQLTGIFPALDAFKVALPSGIARALGMSDRHEREYSHRGALVSGMLTFFLPCGFTQMMQVSAIASGSFPHGALLMSAFAVGTAPGLLGIGGLTAAVRGQSSRLFFKTAGVLVLAFAVFNFGNGYRLTGLASPFGTPAPMANGLQNVELRDGVQVAAMTQTASGYAPDTFTVYRGVPVRWQIDATNVNSCSGGISVPSLSIMKYLKPGANVIEFTPERTGTIRFTCTMGMFPGTFTVIDPPSPSAS